jgi:hypothetical protein
MGSEVEDRIHGALKGHPLGRYEEGYRLVHPSGAGISTLRLLPADFVHDGLHVVAIAEILAEYNSAGLPPFHATGVQRLNSMAVHGAYDTRDGRLRQTGQFSIYENEPAAHFVAQSILNAFGAQLPIGRSMALATVSKAALEQQRAHHNMPRQWQQPVDEESLKSATSMLQRRGLAAANNTNSVWAELALGGECPSRAIDPKAETALLQVNLGIPHPIAGVGYLASISLPFAESPKDGAEMCRRLNAAELEQLHFPPRLGAWGLQGPADVPQYNCFIPSAEPYGTLHMTLLWWCALRAAWLRDRYWVAKQGIVWDKAANARAISSFE